jgi:Cu2+-exporting ATPase
MRSIAAASSALEVLAKLMPSEAHKVMPDGSMKDVPLDELVVGDRVLVKPGEKVPADGTIVEGETSVNEAMLTGESVPVRKQVEGKVIGGSVNGEGSVTVEVKRTGADSYLSQVTELVRAAQESKSRTQNLANRAALILTIVALGVGGITLFVWLVLLGREFVFGLARMVATFFVELTSCRALSIPGFNRVATYSLP